MPLYDQRGPGFDCVRDGDGDVDGRDFLAWQRNPTVGDLSDWQENYGSGGSLVASGGLLERQELVVESEERGEVDPGSAIPGLGVLMIEREAASDVETTFEDSYVEDVDRALEQWNPSALRGKPAVAPVGSFGEMVARRSARVRVALSAGMDF